MFLGQFEHNLDEKGRLTIPARFRELLGEDAFITQGFDRNLMVHTAESFAEIYNSINNTSLTDPTSRLLRRLIFSTASQVEFDRSGRILIPQFLRGIAKMDGSAMVVGQGSYFEIWSTALWADQCTLLQDTEANAQRFAALDLNAHH